MHFKVTSQPTFIKRKEYIPFCFSFEIYQFYKFFKIIIFSFRSALVVHHLMGLVEWRPGTD